MILDRHWWKTDDGRLVPHGDPAARILAYPKGMEIPDVTAAQLGIVAGDELEAKARLAPANKARTPDANK